MKRYVMTAAFAVTTAIGAVAAESNVDVDDRRQDVWREAQGDG
jgi:hypothetical protein